MRGGESPLRRYRPARRDDLPAIVDIYNATIPTRLVTADLEPVTVDSRIAWFDAHEAATRPIWVVDGPGGVIAWLSFSSFYGRPAYRHTAELAVYVADAHRRGGLGRWLVTQAMEAAPQLGVHTLLGFIFGHNQPSLALFESLGFERWGHLPRVAVLDGVERDLIILGFSAAA